MVFKFSKNFSYKNLKNKRRIIKKDTFLNKVVFVNGFSASGKTMLSPIISSINNTESTIYPYEVEWVAGLLYAEQLSQHGFKEFLKMYCDHSIYNQMMSRNSNFRINDVSTVSNKKDFFKYFFRLFQGEDNLIPDVIKKKKPISCLTTSHLIFFVNKIFQALKNRCMFIETVRDPIYMYLQIKILFKEVYKNNPKKLFSFMAKSKGGESLFFDFFSKENAFTDLKKEKNIETICVNYLERIFDFYFNFNFKNITTHKSRFILLPFEKFVIEPEMWTKSILSFLGQKKTSKFLNELKKQHVPRKLLTEGYKRKVYKRYGNVTASQNQTKQLSYKDADLIYIDGIKETFKGNLKDFNRLLNMSNKYRRWIKNSSQFIF